MLVPYSGNTLLQYDVINITRRKKTKRLKKKKKSLSEIDTPNYGSQFFQVIWFHSILFIKIDKLSLPLHSADYQ